MRPLSIILLTLLISCDVKDCFISTGKIIQQEFVVDSFNRIKVGNEVSLIIKYGETQQVIIETGENLIDNVQLKVNDGRLEVEDNSSCNLTRDYAVTKLIVTSPNISEIRSNTARLIKSEGILTYDYLKIISEDFFEDTLTIGDFDLNINNNRLDIVANGNSVFKITGNTNYLSSVFASGTSRLEAQNLIAKNVFISQKSTNDMLVYPLDKIEGTIYNLGNVILFNQPTNINVEELYSGALLSN